MSVLASGNCAESVVARDAPPHLPKLTYYLTFLPTIYQPTYYYLPTYTY